MTGRAGLGEFDERRRERDAIREAEAAQQAKVDAR
jgi:hypothetical protein